MQAPIHLLGVSHGIRQRATRERDSSQSGQRLDDRLRVSLRVPPSSRSPERFGSFAQASLRLQHVGQGCQAPAVVAVAGPAQRLPNIRFSQLLVVVVVGQAAESLEHARFSHVVTGASSKRQRLAQVGFGLVVTAQVSHHIAQVIE